MCVVWGCTMNEIKRCMVNVSDIEMYGETVLQKLL